MKGIDSLLTNIGTLEQEIAKLKGRSSASDVKEAYKQCRYQYKSLEALITYYFPGTADELNGALIDRVAEDDPNERIISPKGLQVVEELIWENDSLYLRRKAVQDELSGIKMVLRRMKEVSSATEFSDEGIFEALQQEIIRMYSLGLAGFDAPASGNSILEAKAAMAGVQQFFGYYEPALDKADKARAAELKQYFIRMATAFAFEEDLEEFNTAYFIQKMAIPLTESLLQAQRALGINYNGLAAPYKPGYSQIFSTIALYPPYYSTQRYEPVSKEQQALGKMLFFDPILSGNNKRACASCHRPEKAFTDGQQKSTAFNFEGSVARNAPTIINSALQGALFWDARLTYLEDQVTAVTNNEQEMHGDFRNTVAVLNKSPEYVQVFKKAFKGTADTTISEQGIRSAIAAYERSLVTYNSRFDRYIQGDELALNAREIAGFTLFMGKGQCGTCHFLPSFGGTVPPGFTTTEWEILGVPATAANTSLDADEGRYAISHKELHRYAFKTPSLRNVALTGPYMHNGVYTSLEEVIAFYNAGGGQGLGYSVPNQTLPSEKLKLNKREKRNLIAFLQALTDTAGLTSKPKKLPAFDDAELNKRKIGGEY